MAEESRTVRRQAAWWVCPTPPDDAAPTECFFCGAVLSSGARRAREHVFPRWLLDRFDARKAPFAQSHTAPVTHASLAERNFVYDAFVAGRVCGDCNNGWMSRLETQVSDVLVRLAEGGYEPGDLDDAKRLVIARWATKTAFAAQAASLGPTLVPAAHRRAICYGDLTGIAVVGRLCSADLGLNFRGSQDWKVPHPAHTRDDVVDRVSLSYKIVLTVGRLVMAVCHWPDPAWPLVVSRVSHFALSPLDGVWLTYGYATDFHGVAPDAHTEITDMTIGTIIHHPLSGGYGLTAIDGRLLLP